MFSNTFCFVWKYRVCSTVQERSDRFTSGACSTNKFSITRIKAELVKAMKKSFVSLMSKYTHRVNRKFHINYIHSISYYKTCPLSTSMESMHNFSINLRKPPRSVKGKKKISHISLPKEYQLHQHPTTCPSMLIFSSTTSVNWSIHLQVIILLIQLSFIRPPQVSFSLYYHIFY